MSQGYENPYSSPAEYGIDPFAAAAAESDRVAFIRNTYLHLAGAVFAFVMIELIVFNIFSAQIAQISGAMMGSQISWLINTRIWRSHVRYYFYIHFRNASIIRVSN